MFFFLLLFQQEIFNRYKLSKNKPFGTNVFVQAESAGIDGEAGPTVPPGTEIYEL